MHRGYFRIWRENSFLAQPVSPCARQHPAKRIFSAQAVETVRQFVPPHMPPETISRPAFFDRQVPFAHIPFLAPALFLFNAGNVLAFCAAPFFSLVKNTEPPMETALEILRFSVLLLTIYFKYDTICNNRHIYVILLKYFAARKESCSCICEAGFVYWRLRFPFYAFWERRRWRNTPRR